MINLRKWLDRYERSPSDCSECRPAYKGFDLVTGQSRYRSDDRTRYQGNIAIAIDSHVDGDVPVLVGQPITLHAKLLVIGMTVKCKHLMQLHFSRSLKRTLKSAECQFMSELKVVCVACGNVTNSIAPPLCDACMKSSPEFQVDMLLARMVLNQVVIPPAEQEVPGHG